jgi:hypothetical protein
MAEAAPKKEKKDKKEKKPKDAKGKKDDKKKKDAKGGKDPLKEILVHIKVSVYMYHKRVCIPLLSIH